ncbi:MAG: hypothetical protein HYS20_15330, partial [Rhodocyclales bacterium]|nr:hypothetical protein [Rhodocyclales bacterium]
DHAIRGIVASNVLTIAVAVAKGWGVAQLLWPFWIQSVIIGYYARRRMLALQEFSTDGFAINDQPVDPTPATQRSTANFFALHYGFFHFVYLVFLLSMSAAADSAGLMPFTNEDTGAVTMVRVGQTHAIDFVIFAALGIGFWFSHRASHREHVAADLARRPNIGSLMFLPYARVIPMHLTILGGAMLGGGGGIWLFGILKLGADVVMHKVEHKWLQSAAHTRRSHEP